MKYLLAIDVGNTRTSIGLFAEGILIKQWHIATCIDRTCDEVWAIVHSLFIASGIKSEEIKSISIASVVPKVTQTISAYAKERFAIKPLIINAEIVRCLKIQYNPPSSVGADRLCVAVAAFKRTGGPLIVLDFGTATVLDVVSMDGIYRGGLIAPGLQSSMNALHTATSLLPRVELKFPEDIVGRNTIHAIQSGILNGAVEMISGLIQRIKKTEPGIWKIYATGGYAEILRSHLPDIQYVVPDLVLEGILGITEDQ